MDTLITKVLVIVKFEMTQWRSKDFQGGEGDIFVRIFTDTKLK